MAACKIHILSRLTHKDIASSSSKMFFFSSRKLSHQEIQFIRATGIKRYYLKTLSADQERMFFSAFEVWWEKVIKEKGPGDSFWRNIVSSKMQEWENSVGYLALVLFALSKDPALEDIELIILPDSIEEAAVWKAWVLSCHWTVVSYGFGLFEQIWQEMENILRMVRLAGIFIMKKWRAYPIGFQVSPGAFLIVTLFYRRILDQERYEDQFFGKLHEDIERSGQDAFYLADSIDELKPNDEARMGRRGWPVSIYSLVSWRDLWAGLWCVLRQNPCFKDCFFEDVDFSALLIWHSRRARYDYNLTAEFFYRAVRAACRKQSFSKMLYAFEGNVYERAAVQAFRELAPSALVDAYSHAVIYPLNLKLYLTSSEPQKAPEPDRYLICGDYARDALLRIRRMRVPVLSVCFLRTIPRLIEQGKIIQKEVLVVLDGLWSAVNLLNWLYEHSSALEGYKVSIRPHPNVSGQRLFSQCSEYREGLFHISQRSLEEDLRYASCVLYRQSSVGVMALMNSIPIIHLGVNIPLAGDPLENLKVGKISVRDEESLRKALFCVPDMHLQLQKNAKEVLAVAQNYFIAPSLETKRIFLESSFAAYASKEGL